MQLDSPIIYDKVIISKEISSSNIGSKYYSKDKSRFIFFKMNLLIKNIKLKYNEIFYSNFSILAKLGDLSNYSNFELSTILKKWNKSETIYHNHHDISWQNKAVLITVRYNVETGKYIKIVKEEWKLYNLKFERN